MKFTPNCTVCYHGKFHIGGVAFEIDEDDAEELSKLGEIERTCFCVEEKEEHPAEKSEERAAPSSPPRRGRPRKAKGDST